MLHYDKVYSSGLKLERLGGLLCSAAHRAFSLLKVRNKVSTKNSKYALFVRFRDLYFHITVFNWSDFSWCCDNCCPDRGVPPVAGVYSGECVSSAAHFTVWQEKCNNQTGVRSKGSKYRQMCFHKWTRPGFSLVRTQTFFLPDKRAAVGSEPWSTGYSHLTIWFKPNKSLKIRLKHCRCESALRLYSINSLRPVIFTTCQTFMIVICSCDKALLLENVQNNH